MANNEMKEKARELFQKGNSPKEIADALGIPEGTVRSWKSRGKWCCNESATLQKENSVALQSKKNATAQKPMIDDGTKETLQNDDLTPEQQMFCIYYSRTFNAAQSYQKAYGCSYESALRAGPRLLGNVVVREELERLKEIKRQQIVAGADDIVELQMRIAFSDMGNYMTIKNDVAVAADSACMDTQLIKEVKQGKDGVSIKLADPQKAIDWLTKYFLIHPDDKYKAEFDRKRAELGDNTGEEILRNMQTITDILQNPVPNRNISDYEGGDNDE